MEIQYTYSAVYSDKNELEIVLNDDFNVKDLNDSRICTNI